MCSDNYYAIYEPVTAGHYKEGILNRTVVAWKIFAKINNFFEVVCRRQTENSCNFHAAALQAQTCTYSNSLHFNFNITKLTPRSRVLPEKLRDSQLLKNLPELYVTRRFITAITTVRHVFLSWARSIQFVPPIPPYVVPKDQSGSEVSVYDS